MPQLVNRRFVCQLESGSWFQGLGHIFILSLLEKYYRLLLLLRKLNALYFVPNPK